MIVNDRYGIGLVPIMDKIYNMKKVISLSCLAIALLTACKKDNSEDTGNRMDLITSASWKYDNAQVDVTGDEEGDQPLPPGTLEDCDKDNIITFYDDNTGTIDEGPTKCDGGDPQQVDFEWEFKNNNTVINIPQTIFGNISGDAKIKILNATKLRLVKQVQITNPIPATVNLVIDLKH